jgi:hypothetical protein
MSNNYKKAVRNLDAWLAEDSEQPVEALRQELCEQGVNVDAFLARFETVVRKGLQHQMKAEADREQRDAEAKPRHRFGDLTTKTRVELERLFESVRLGVFGDHLKSAALARCCNHTGEQVSETELRSWLEDISEAGDA